MNSEHMLSDEIKKDMCESGIEEKDYGPKTIRSEIDPSLINPSDSPNDNYSSPELIDVRKFSRYSSNGEESVDTNAVLIGIAEIIKENQPLLELFKNNLPSRLNSMGSSVKTAENQPTSQTSPMEQAIAEMECHMDDSKEEVWQQIFKKYPWILTLIFDQPHIFFKEKAYVGGKSVDNRDGYVCDFLYQNARTKNVALIEIKNPCAGIIAGSYRNKIYSLSADLTGALNQVLKYRDTIIKNYYSLFRKGEEEFCVNNPPCVVVIGKLSGMNEEQMEDFDRFRNELSNVTVIAFDEILDIVKSIRENLRLLQ